MAPGAITVISWVPPPVLASWPAKDGGHPAVVATMGGSVTVVVVRAGGGGGVAVLRPAQATDVATASTASTATSSAGAGGDLSACPDTIGC